MAHQVFDLDADEYVVGAVSKRWLKAPRPLVDAALVPSGQTRYLDLVVARRENDRGGVFHFEEVATGSRTDGHDLSAQVESSGTFRITVGETHFDFPVSSDTGGDEPYVIDFSGQTQTDFNTWRDANLPNTGTVAATFTIWDGAGTNPFIDVTPPAFVSAVTNTAGTQIILTYDETLASGSVPATSAYTVTPARTISSVVVAGATVTLTLTTALAEGAAVALSYVVPSANPLQDVAGNEAVALTNQAVTNQTDVTAPTFASAGTSDRGDTIAVEFGEALDAAHVPAIGAFDVQVAGAARAVAAAGVAISGTTLTLTLASNVANGETVTVAYTQPATAATRLQDAAGNEVATFAAQTVTNNVPADPFASDLVTITLTDIFNTVGTDEQWWREPGGVPADVIRQDTAGNIFVYAYNYTGVSPLNNVAISMPRLTATIEEDAGEVVFETTDRTELLRFELPTYRVLNESESGYVSPDQSVATMAAIIAYKGDLVFRVTLGMEDHPIAPEFSGTASGVLAVTPAHNEAVETFGLAPQYSGSAAGALTGALNHNESPEAIGIDPRFVGGTLAGTLAIAPAHNESPEAVGIAPAFAGSMAGLILLPFLDHSSPHPFPEYRGHMGGVLGITLDFTETPEAVGIAPQWSGSTSGVLTVPDLVIAEVVEEVPLAPEFSASMSGLLTATLDHTEQPESFEITPRFRTARFRQPAFVATLDHNEAVETFGIAPQFTGSMAGAYVAALVHNESPEGFVIRPAYAGRLTGLFDARIIKRILAWPAILPDVFLREGFNLRPRPAVAAFAPTRGRPMTRPLVTQPLTDYVGTFLMTAGEWRTLLDFYRVNTQQGRGQFDLPDPLAVESGDLIRVKFADPPRRARRGAEYAVSVRLTGHPSD